MIYSFSYDAFGNVTGVDVGNRSLIDYTYRANNGLLSRADSGNGWSSTFSYTYDANGNILTIKDGNALIASYSYDALNQLVRENVNTAALSQTVTYSYDLGGNLQTVKRYAYTTGNLNGLTPVSTDTYSYTDSSWRDLLTAYNGHSISYDQIGNPITYHNGLSFTWEKGRQRKNT